VSLDLVLVPHGGQPRELRINRKTGEFIAGRDIVPVAERGGFVTCPNEDLTF
jgi:hypothetical protein